MNSLQISLNEVGDLLNVAMQADSKNNGSVEMKLDVYQKYVKCVKEIFVILDADLTTYSSGNKSEDLKSIRQNHLSILTTMRNCVNRSIIQISDDPNEKPPYHAQSLHSEMGAEQKPFKLRSLPAISSIDLLLAEKPVTPTTSARCNIQRLITATNTLLKSERLSASEKASIQLRINRKIEENLSIARKQEEQLCKVNTDNLEQLFKKIDEDIVNHKILKDNSDFQLLYRNSQLFHYHILKDSRTYSLVQSRRSPESSCLSFLLKMTNVHPIVSFLDRSIEKIVTIKISKENANTFLEEIKIFKDNIENLSKLCCLIMNMSLSDHISNIASKLLLILFEFIFKNPKLGPFIYNFLFEIYDEDIKQYYDNVKFIKEEYSYEILLPEKFKKHPDVISIIDKQVLEFDNIRPNFNPLEKIDILSKIVTDLMSKIQNQNSELEIGADELIPILVYMIIRFNSAEIFLHGKYLDHLLPDSYLIGLEGYMLVSIICAITCCVSENFRVHVSKPC